MKNKWGIYVQCINEKELVEAKIEWALRHGMSISICEGHHPNYKNFDPKTHLSNDGTTEILKSYSDRINYIPIGEVPWQGALRDRAYKGLPKDLDICIMSDIDEFILEKDLKTLDNIYSANKDLKLTLTNSYIFLDNEYCCPHLMPPNGNFVKYSKRYDLIQMGQWHERVFRYNKYYNYTRSPFLINDIYGGFIFSNSGYYDERTILPNLYILHYKNFKMVEAKKRHQMYKDRGDKVDYNLEWDVLEKNKIKYKGKHPIEIQRLMK